MTTDEISVDLRLNSKPGSKCKAFADVTVPLGNDGVVKMFGYSVMEKDNGRAWVGPPARKGQSAFFPVVKLAGKIESLVSETVLRAYREASQPSK